MGKYFTQDGFTWDSQKNIANFSKHKISFEEAREIFEDDYRFTDDDIANSIAEDRFQSIGRIKRGTLIMVAYTINEGNESSGYSEVIHIISARKTTANERRRYESQRNF